MDEIDARTVRLEADLLQLLEESRTTDRNAKHAWGLVVATGKPYAWEPLPSHVRPLQRQLRDQWRALCAFNDSAILHESPAFAADARSVMEWIRAVIDQDEAIGLEKAAVLQETVKKLNWWRTQLRERSLGSPGDILLIADTSALYALPQLDRWKFDGIQRFAIYLVPAVLRELDEHKHGHRRPEVVEKARQLVRQIREYRKRGPLTAGVTVRRDQVRLVGWAEDPKGATAPPQLDLTNADDRILASALDIGRAYRLSRVALVTDDGNLQNKCELAGVSYLWPPEGKESPENIR